MSTTQEKTCGRDSLNRVVVVSVCVFVLWDSLWAPVHLESTSIRPSPRQCVPTCPSVSLCIPSCPNMSQCVPVFPNVSQCVPFFPNISKCFPTCPDVSTPSEVRSGRGFMVSSFELWWRRWRQVTPLKDLLCVCFHLMDKQQQPLTDWL